MAAFKSKPTEPENNPRFYRMNVLMDAIASGKRRKGKLYRLLTGS